MTARKYFSNIIFLLYYFYFYLFLAASQKKCLRGMDALALLYFAKI